MSSGADRGDLFGKDRPDKIAGSRSKSELPCLLGPDKDKTAGSDSKSRAQHCSSVQRDRFLRLLLSIKGREATFHMYEKTTIKGILRGADTDFEHLAVSDLHTPIGIQKEALIRTSDIISFSVDI